MVVVTLLCIIWVVTLVLVALIYRELHWLVCGKKPKKSKEKDG